MFKRRGGCMCRRNGVEGAAGETCRSRARSRVSWSFGRWQVACEMPQMWWSQKGEKYTIKVLGRSGENGAGFGKGGDCTGNRDVGSQGWFSWSDAVGTSWGRWILLEPGNPRGDAHRAWDLRGVLPWLWGLDLFFLQRNWVYSELRLTVAHLYN